MVDVQVSGGSLVPRDTAWYPWAGHEANVVGVQVSGGSLVPRDTGTLGLGMRLRGDLSVSV